MVVGKDTTPQRSISTIEGAGGKMVFVKVRETYDLKTVQNKMTVIGIHTPKPDIIKKNYPGLLMQCRAYRPVSCDVRLACASVLPLDPLGVGTEAGDVAPEDVFNPILYKAMSNKGMSQLEARINGLTSSVTGVDVEGNSAVVDVDSITNSVDEFPIYYGLLSNTHDWKHAGVQSGLTMSGLKPVVYDVLINQGDSMPIDYSSDLTGQNIVYPGVDGSRTFQNIRNNNSMIVGNAQPMPFINCTAYSLQLTEGGTGVSNTYQAPGFYTDSVNNCEAFIPWIRAFVGAIIVPPSRLHSLYFRMVVEWTIEFSKLRPIGEITDWYGLSQIGSATHYQNYSYESAKSAFIGDDRVEVMDKDTCMVSSNADVDKVM